MTRLLLLALVACADAPDAPEPIGPTCGTDGQRITLPYDADRVAGCGWWRGSIHVPDASEPDTLAPLRGLTGLDGELTIFRNHALADLRDLSRLEVIGGELAIYIDISGVLTSVAGLGALRETGGLRFESNPDLANLRGLGRLEVVHGDVHFQENPALPHGEVDWLLARIDVQGAIVVDLPPR